MSLVKFTQVAHKAKRAAIVATGPSLKGKSLEFEEDVAVIAVNSAIYYQDDCDYWFTLDPSPTNIDIMANPISGVSYYAAVPLNFRNIFNHVNYLRRLEGNGHGRFKTKPYLSNDPRAIHTGNSAWGAFQLAVLMGCTRIALFGVDGAGSYHYGGHPRNLTMVPGLFLSSVPELRKRRIEVVNGSKTSRVTCFPRMEPEKAADWICTRQL